MVLSYQRLQEWGTTLSHLGRRFLRALGLYALNLLRYIGLLVTVRLLGEAVKMEWHALSTAEFLVSSRIVHPANIGQWSMYTHDLDGKPPRYRVTVDGLRVPMVEEPVTIDYRDWYYMDVTTEVAYLPGNFESI
ncbi:uncharacterized protein JN550_001167 [Neoarthrinium moseri]|uniref:uncharacterized protein n=1 Tax=Neoarthrinium moseri TaxID=1658444 RepID=UPI001FDE5238|nr:uncharacterized protein JN550_001167 [Neoarthrinium moseri]KAI1877095.1 hypothetical protein JN550_001167 [Neoarthrinium moseri]